MIRSTTAAMTDSSDTTTILHQTIAEILRTLTNSPERFQVQNRDLTLLTVPSRPYSLAGSNISFKLFLGSHCGLLTTRCSPLRFIVSKERQLSRSSQLYPSCV